MAKINKKEEMGLFLQEFKGDEVLDAFLRTLENKSLDLMSKVLLFEKGNKKVLIHFNAAGERLERREDLNAIFLIFGDSNTGRLNFKSFIEKDNFLKNAVKFIKEKTDRAFSDYVSCELHTHLCTLDKSYKNKLLEYENKLLESNEEDLYNYIENNEIDINYIKNLFKDNKKVNSSILVNKILNDKNNIILNTNDEVIYDENLGKFFKMCGIKNVGEIDLEHFACRYLMAIKDSEILFSNVAKIIKFLTSLNDSESESVFEKVNDPKTKKNYETIKRTIVNKWTCFDISKIKVLEIKSYNEV